MLSDFLPRLRRDRIVAVLIIDDVAQIPPLVEALREGGVTMVELTLRTESALDALAAMRREARDFLVGAGTVLTPDQVRAVKERGSDFAVSPGCNPRVLTAAKEAGLPFAPGVMTPTDIEFALESGCRVLKFFPAETSGGLAHLKSMAAPYQHLDVQFIPLGGVNEENFVEYLNSPLIPAVGGSWIAPRALINDGNWAEITQRAQAARSALPEIADR